MWTDNERDLVVQHVEGAWFDPATTVKVGRNLAGLNWYGHTLQATDMIAVEEAHYLKHVVQQQEWPDGTTLAAYRSSIKMVVRDGETGVLVNEYNGTPQLTFVRRSLGERGVGGHSHIMVEYVVGRDEVRTAFQPRNGMAHFSRLGRKNQIWMLMAK